MNENCRFKVVEEIFEGRLRGNQLMLSPRLQQYRIYLLLHLLLTQPLVGVALTLVYLVLMVSIYSSVKVALAIGKIGSSIQKKW